MDNYSYYVREALQVVCYNGEKLSYELGKLKKNLQAKLQTTILYILASTLLSGTLGLDGLP
jgi:hypothetical protein